MKIRKKLAALGASLGLAAAGLTAVSSMSDAFTPSAEAAGCGIHYSPWRLKAQVVNDGCSGYAQYYEYRRNMYGQSYKDFARKAYKGKWNVSRFYLPYTGTYSSGFRHVR